MGRARNQLAHIEGKTSQQGYPLQKHTPMPQQQFVGQRFHTYAYLHPVAFPLGLTSRAST
jgi:hypothetical protein